MKNLIFLVFLILIQSCSKEDSKSISEEIIPSENLHEDFKKDSLELNTKAEIPLNKSIELGNFKGKIGKDLEVYFHLENKEGQVSGFYFYEKSGIDITLLGSIRNNFVTLYTELQKRYSCYFKCRIEKQSIDWFLEKSKFQKKICTKSAKNQRRNKFFAQRFDRNL